jgi:hypothetical protein
MERYKYSVRVGRREYSNYNPNRLIRRMGRKHAGYEILSHVSFFGAGLLALGGIGEIAVGAGYGGRVGAAIGLACAIVTEAGAYGLFKLSHLADRKAEAFGTARMSVKAQIDPFYAKLRR